MCGCDTVDSHWNVELDDPTTGMVHILKREVGTFHHGQTLLLSESGTQAHADSYGQNVDVFHSKSCEDIPDATSSRNGLLIDAHPKMTKDVPEETRSPAQ